MGCFLGEIGGEIRGCFALSFWALSLYAAMQQFRKLPDGIGTLR